MLPISSAVVPRMMTHRVNFLIETGIPRPRSSTSTISARPWFAHSSCRLQHAGRYRFPARPCSFFRAGHRTSCDTDGKAAPVAGCRLRLVANNHFHDLWSQPPVAPIRRLSIPSCARCWIPRSRSHCPDACTKVRSAACFFQKTRFKRLHDAFRHANEGHGSGSNGISVLDHGSSFCCRNEIRPHCLNPANFRRQWPIPDHRRCTC